MKGDKVQFDVFCGNGIRKQCETYALCTVPLVLGFLPHRYNDSPSTSEGFCDGDWNTLFESTLQTTNYSKRSHCCVVKMRWFKGDSKALPRDCPHAVVLSLPFCCVTVWAQAVSHLKYRGRFLRTSTWLPRGHPPWRCHCLSKAFICSFLSSAYCSSLMFPVPHTADQGVFDLPSPPFPTPLNTIPYPVDLSSKPLRRYSPTQHNFPSPAMPFPTLFSWNTWKLIALRLRCYLPLKTQSPVEVDATASTWFMKVSPVLGIGASSCFKSIHCFGLLYYTSPWSAACQVLYMVFSWT